MDICLPELAQIEDEPLYTTAAALLTDTWLTLWVRADSAHEESERAALRLCAALLLVTSEEARLN